MRSESNKNELSIKSVAGGDVTITRELGFTLLSYDGIDIKFNQLRHTIKTDEDFDIASLRMACNTKLDFSINLLIDAKDVSIVDDFLTGL